MAHDTLYAIGEALIDMIPAETGCDFGAVSSFAPRGGGAPANVAAAFARLGGRSALLTQLGDDPFGAKITAELAGAGVDVSHIATTDRANTALAFVSLQAPARLGRWSASIPTCASRSGLTARPCTAPCGSSCPRRIF